MADEVKYNSIQEQEYNYFANSSGGKGTGIRVLGTNCWASGRNISIPEGAVNVNLINCNECSCDNDVVNFTGIGLSNYRATNLDNNKVMIGEQITEVKPRYYKELLLGGM